MYLISDIGGTKMRIAWSQDGITFADPVVIATPQDPQLAIEHFCKTAGELAGDAKIQGVAIGLPGPFDREHGSLLSAPHLPQWVGVSLKEEIKKRLGAEVLLENDAALVGLGEAHYGAGRGSEVVAYLTFSTGVGGVRIVKGDIAYHTHDFEPGHQIVNIDSLLYENHTEVTLHEYAAGSAIEKRFGVQPSSVRNEMFWRAWEKIVAVGLYNTTLFWGPDAIVLGGSVITENENVSTVRIENRLAELMRIYPEIPDVRTAELKDQGGLWGALALLKSSR